MMTDDKKETRFGKPMIDETVLDLLPSDVPPTIAAATTTTAYDMKVETISEDDVCGF